MLCLVIAPSAIAAPLPPPGYTVYAGCGTASGIAPSHFCHRGEPLVAFFESDLNDAVYDLCVLLPVPLRVCSYGQPATKGVLHVAKFSSSLSVYGPTSLSWSVGGISVGTWEIDVYPDPILPRFGVSPLIVSRTHQLFGLVLRHVPADARVRAWRKCEGSCPLPMRLSSSHGKTRRYEIVGSQAGATFSLGETLYVQVDAPGKLDNDNEVWGRLYEGKLIRDRRGGPTDTAIRRIGNLLCTPPEKTYRAATTCDQVSG